MQSFIYFFMIFAASLATDVSVYTASEFFNIDSTPVTEAVSCFSFGYHWADQLRLRIYFKNKPGSVSAIKAVYKFDTETVERVKLLDKEIYGEYFWIHRVLNFTEVKISLQLYKSRSLCSSTLIAEGMKISSSRDEITKKTYRDHICTKVEPCVLLVNLEHECEGNLVENFNEREMSTPAARMVTDFKNLNNTFNAPTSSHKNPETTTYQTTGNNTSAKSTNNTVTIVVSFFSGVTFTLLAIITIWKRCWKKQSPQATPDLPTNQNTQPFYLNMLFRKECDLEIAELEQHDYEEIKPRVTEDQHVEISPRVTAGS